MAQGIASQGCAVSLWGRNAGKNAQAAEVISKLGGGKVDTQVCDVADIDYVNSSKDQRAAYDKAGYKHYDCSCDSGADDLPPSSAHRIIRHQNLLNS